MDRERDRHIRAGDRPTFGRRHFAFKNYPQYVPVRIVEGGKMTKARLIIKQDKPTPAVRIVTPAFRGVGGK